jgi:hypothetical protein
MIFAKKDEQKRSMLWRGAMITSSMLIIVIAIFLLMKMFTGNPLEGTWVSEEDGYKMTIKNRSTLTVKVVDIAEETSVDVKLAYSMDKEEKTITIKEDKSEFEKLADKSDGAYTEEALEAALGSLLTTFDYSVDGNELTLTEREYGDQMVLLKE